MASNGNKLGVVWPKQTLTDGEPVARFAGRELPGVLLDLLQLLVDDYPNNHQSQDP